MVWSTVWTPPSYGFVGKIDLGNRHNCWLKRATGTFTSVEISWLTFTNPAAPFKLVSGRFKYSQNTSELKGVEAAWLDSLKSGVSAQQ